MSTQTVPGALQEEWLQELAAEMSLPPVSPAVAQLLLPTVETEIRRLIQIAHKFQKRGKHRRLTVHAVNLALGSSNMEPLYGLHRSAHLKETLSSRAEGHPFGGGAAEGEEQPGVLDGVLVEDRVVSLVELARQPLPKCPLASEVRLHWLAVDGVQPRTVDNPVVQQRDASLEPPADLSREMQYLYSRIVKMIMGAAGGGPVTAPGALGAKRAVSSSLTDLVCQCLRSDAGLQELVPYLCRFVYLQTKQHTRDVGLLMALMQMANAMLDNPKLNVVPCLHQLLPAVFTCVVGAAGGGKPSTAKDTLSDRASLYRWQLREQAARVIAAMCARFGSSFTDLYPRVCKTYFNAMHCSDGASPNAQSLFGGLVGAQALGHKAVQTLVIPYVDQLQHTVSSFEPDRPDGDCAYVIVRDAMVTTLGKNLLHILKSADMRRRTAPTGKRKAAAVTTGGRKRLKVESGAVTATPEEASRDVPPAQSGRDIERSALDDLAESLVPYYCAGSVMHDYCRMFI